MTIRQFEIFLALAKTPNMRAVASQFFLSQAAVSSSLHAFENEIGSSLFYRVNNKLILNEKGKLLQSKLTPLLGEIKNIVAMISDQELAGKMKIGASTTLADFIIPQVLYDFNKKYQDVSISCEAENTAEVAHKVELGEYDVGFVEGEVQSINLNVSPLVKEKLLIVTSDEEFAKGGPYPISALTDKEWLIREKGSAAREVLLDKLAQHGLRPKKFMEFNHYRPIKTILKNPNTLSCLSGIVVADQLQNKALFAVKVTDAEFTRTYYKVEHRDKVQSPLINLVSSAIQEQLQNFFQK